jgi:hypothetical protein
MLLYVTSRPPPKCLAFVSRVRQPCRADMSAVDSVKGRCGCMTSNWSIGALKACIGACPHRTPRSTH